MAVFFEAGHTEVVYTNWRYRMQIKWLAWREQRDAAQLQARELKKLRGVDKRP